MPSVDENIQNLLKGLAEREPTPLQNIHRRVFLLSTPRTASSYLSDLLSASEVMGSIAEWFNPRYIQNYFAMASTNAGLQDYVRFILSRAASPEGVFTVNVHIDHWRILKDEYGFDLLDLGLHSIYHLSREDKIAQAYSYALAKKTDGWAGTMQSGDSGDEEGQVSAVEVTRFLHYIVQAEDTFKDRIRGCVSCPVHEVSHEALVKEPATWLQWILEAEVGLKNLEAHTESMVSSVGEGRQSSGERRSRVDAIRKYLCGGHSVASGST